MGDLRLSGLASGLDSEAIITQLLQLERAPRTRFELKERQLQARTTAWNDIASRLRNLRTAAADLRSATVFADVQAVETSDATKVAAKRVSGAGVGAYRIEVTQLVRAEQRTYDYTASGSATALVAGGHATAIAANATLDEVVAAVNGDRDATVYAANVGGRLVLSNRASGATAIDLTGTTLGVAEDGTKLRAGQDLTMLVDGVAYTRSSNTVTDVVPGLELTLKTTFSGADAATVTVGPPGPDRAAIKDKVKAFVEQYNSTVDFVRSKLNEERVAQPKTEADRMKGLLRGDTMLTGVLQRLRAAISDAVPGNPSTLDQLSELGVTTGKPSGDAKFSIESVAGKLVLDEAKLDAVLASDPAGVKQLLGAGGIDGFAQKLEGLIDPVTGTGGLIDERKGSIDSELKRVRSSMARVDERLAHREQTLRAMFARLETALSASQSQQAWLAGQLAQLG